MISIEMDNIFKVTVIKLLKGKSNSAGSNYFLHWKVWICHYRCKRISGRISLYPRYKIILRAVIRWACHCHYLFILSTNKGTHICYVIYTGNRKRLLVWISLRNFSINQQKFCRLLKSLEWLFIPNFSREKSWDHSL